MLFSTFILDTSNPFPYGMLVFIAAQAYALSDRYRAVQARLRAALAEKDMLIREVHHRVKNSLQIVASIVALQSHRSADPSAVAAYVSIRDRIRAILLLSSPRASAPPTASSSYRRSRGSGERGSSRTRVEEPS